MSDLTDPPTLVIVWSEDDILPLLASATGRDDQDSELRDIARDILERGALRNAIVDAASDAIQTLVSEHLSDLARRAT